MNRTHGRIATYAAGCRCWRCIRAHRVYHRGQAGFLPVADIGDCLRDHDWVLLNFPAAIVARRAVPDDAEAIAAAFPGHADPTTNRPEEVNEQ